MKSFILAVACLLTVSASAQAQSELDKALAPLGERAKASAMVVHWNADHSYRTLQEGTSQQVCYDRSSERGRGAFAVQCTSKANLDRVAQNRRFRAETTDRAGENAMIAAAEANGTRAEVAYGSMWIAMSGDDMGSAGIHTTIAVPGATAASTGFPTTRDGGGAFLMAAGTAGAHIMVPGR
jgi:multidrug resistance efflux pump